MPKSLKTELNAAVKASQDLNEKCFAESMNADKEKKAQELLKSVHLIRKIDAELDRKIEKEPRSRLTIFITACGMFVKNHQAASYNLMVNSNSGAGKSFIAKHVIEIFPESLWVYRTRISPTVFNYWHNSKFEPAWTWDGKICYLEDISNSILNHPVFKVMCSEGSQTTITINQMAIDIIINGKPVMIVTIAEAEPKSETLRRFPISTMDETEEQTKAIMKRQARTAIKNSKTEYDEVVTTALGILKRVNVFVPFADKLPDLFPGSNIIARTHFPRFLDLIKASAALHQYQRDRTTDDTIEANWIDYEIARIALLHTTQNAQLIPLTRKQRQVLEICKKQNKEWYSVTDLSKGNPFLVESKWYEYMDILATEGFFDTNTEEREGSKKPVRVFKLRSEAEFTIPSLQDLGVMGVEGVKVVMGIQGVNELLEWINSLNSFNSPLKMPHISPSNPSNPQKWDEKSIVWLKCSFEGCPETQCNYDSENGNEPRCREHLGSKLKVEAEDIQDGSSQGYKELSFLGGFVREIR